MKKVAMIGSGAWGTAVATVLAYNGYTVNLWSNENSVVKIIQKDSQNTLFLPDITLDKKIVPTSSLDEAFNDVEYIFFAVPVKFSRTILEKCEPFFNKEQIWVFLNKGIEQETLLLPTEIAQSVFKGLNKVATCVGPSFAKDVALKRLTGVVCASEKSEIASLVQSILQNEYFKVSVSNDTRGVQLSAALKNVITLSMGILDGADCADNTKAFFFTSLLQEITHVVLACNGKKETLYSLAGIGDIVLTTFGSQSRNLEVGKKIGKGQSLPEIVNAMDSSPESINTLHSLQKLIQEKSLMCPLIEGIYFIIQSKKTVADLLTNL